MKRNLDSNSPTAAFRINSSSYGFEQEATMPPLISGIEAGQRRRSSWFDEQRLLAEAEPNHFYYGAFRDPDAFAP
jgi:hypothetical protein